MNILIFSGTSDGNEIIEQLVNLPVHLIVSVATEYGKKLINNINLINKEVEILSQRLNSNEMENVIIEKQIKIVIDATHPYATEVSCNIKEACSKTQIKYYRLLREQSQYDAHITLVENIEKACEITVSGNVLATTGSKQIHEYTTLVDYKTRLYSRVLPTEESVQLCKKAGLDESKIIQSLGALSVEENVETIRRYNIKNLITKDGGVKGGFPQKSEACKLTDTKLIVIKRPKETTEFYSTDEIFSSILKEIN